MAFVDRRQGSIAVVPAGTLILPPLPSPPALPPFVPPPAGFFPLPRGAATAAAVPNPSQRILFHPATVPRPHPAVLFRVDPAVVIRMDEERTKSLLQFMADEGLVPSPEEEAKRKNAIDQLRQIVLAWIKKVAWQRGLPKNVIASASATVLTYGSYGLGVHGCESDIDALCVGPHFATMEEDFFIVLLDMLKNRPEVSEIHCVKSAKVPLMRFKFNGISIDFPYAQLQVKSVPHTADIFDLSLFAKVDETSWRSLSGVRANTRILQLVPNLKNFQSMLRCIKLWAKRRGVYSHLLGFFGGIHLAILAAHVCQRHPNASISALISFFFQTFSQWCWPQPVILLDHSVPFRRPDGRSLMPIMMPCSPFEWCNSNITRSTFQKIVAEFHRGCTLTRDLGRIDFEWTCLFEAFSYAKEYDHFVRIFLAAPDANELQDWVGWVKSRFRSLLLKLEMLLGFCDPNPTEYVDHNFSQPNIVFYWGLLPNGSTLIDIDFVKEEFMKSVNNDIYSNKSSSYKLELSYVEASQLPKNVSLDSGVVKASKACWRILDHDLLRRPVYSQYVPRYFMGYVATDR